MAAATRSGGSPWAKAAVIAAVALVLLVAGWLWDAPSTEELHTRPTFAGSFASLSLGLCGAYLGVLALWAGLRREWDFFLRNATVAAATFLLVSLYLMARGGFAYNGHNWNRSFGDASVILYAATMAMGPLARLWRPASFAQAWRRETGVWATIAALIHVGIFLEWSLGWDWRPFFYPGHSGATADSLMGDRAAGLRPDAFNVANVVGLVALAYALILAITSNDASQRRLRSGWSWLQQRSTTMWMLVLLHAWIFAYYIEARNALLTGTVWAGFWLVLLVQTAAFVKTVSFRRRRTGV